MVDERRNISSSFDGNIEEIPEIAVDNFTDKSKMAYFLSHMHSDHTVGLFGKNESEELQRNGAKIYMSEESKIILSYEHFNFDNIEELVEPLKLGMTYTIDLAQDNAFEVILIPVKHMVGAVMFLFKTRGRNVLFTGDFVINREETLALRKLHGANGEPINLNTLYIDSTFDNPDYEYFPTRNECHNTIVEIVQDWLDRDKGGVSLFSNYKYGYEDLYIALKNNVTMKNVRNIRIFLNSSKTCKIFDKLCGVDENPLTTDANSKIHVCKNRDQSETHDACGVRQNYLQNYLHIYISATRGYDYRPGLNNAIVRQDNNIIYLCYPTHCSRRQLTEFKEYFSPTRVVTFPVSVRTPGMESPFRRDRV